MQPEALPKARARVRTVRAVFGVLTLVVGVWLGYAFGRGQSLSEISRLYRDTTVSNYTIDTGQMIAQYARDGGDLKPLLMASDGTALMDYSDWDYTSVVIVDGVRYEMVRLVPSSTVDYERHRIVQGLRASDWELSRELTLTGASAEMKFTFLADRPVHDVRVVVAHVNWYFLQVDLNKAGFVASVAHASRAEEETGVIRKPAYQVTLNSSVPTELPPDFVRIGQNSSYGVQSVDTEYHLVDPPVGRYVPLATETVTFQAAKA